jgi:hypothetical protein
MVKVVVGGMVVSFIPLILDKNLHMLRRIHQQKRKWIIQTIYITLFPLVIHFGNYP